MPNGGRLPGPFPEELERKFTRTLDSLPAVVEFLQSCLTSWHAGEESAYVLHLALEELFTNAVKYAGQGAGDVDVFVRRSDGKVSVRLSVEGTTEFDVTATPPPDPSIPIGEKRVGGLGLFLTRSLVDTLEYRFSEGRSTVTFTKMLEGPHVRNKR
jgi:serine/threonine-protein kinase RsbW